MSNHAAGHYAEKVAARYLRAQGYKVYALNWRHPRAEIDIVAGAPGSGSPVFVEVKYRRTAGQGGGLDYITSAKLRQMQFAAALWVAQHRYAGMYALAAVEVSGSDYEVTSFVPDVN